MSGIWRCCFVGGLLMPERGLLQLGGSFGAEKGGRASKKMKQLNEGG